jgi:hypothetical protein
VKLQVADENQSEINDIAGAMKLWFRELPEPLLTWNLYASFIEAGRFESTLPLLRSATHASYLVSGIDVFFFFLVSLI